MNASLRQSVIPSRSAKLRQMLDSPQLEFLMEAHNGLSARIVREAGFGGIWASGLSISAQSLFRISTMGNLGPPDVEQLIASFARCRA